MLGSRSSPWAHSAAHEAQRSRVAQCLVTRDREGAFDPGVQGPRGSCTCSHNQQHDMPRTDVPCRSCEQRSAFAQLSRRSERDIRAVLCPGAGGCRLSGSPRRCAEKQPVMQPSGFFSVSVQRPRVTVPYKALATNTGRRTTSGGHPRRVPQDSASPLIRRAYKPAFRERSDSPGAASAQMRSGHRENGTGDGCQTWLS